MALTPEQFRRAEALFLAAGQRPATERAAFVEQACADDAVVRAEVLIMLRHDETPDAALQSTALAGALRNQVAEAAAALAHAARREPPAGLPADAIPGYQIVAEIHRGGQGVVYQALQQGTNRNVAVKVLLEGPYASAAARKRFEREIELAAQLKHPHIISIFHSGETSDGRQFYVMDYVRGAPLTRHAREQHLPLEEALRLLATVCEAVQHAHQRGIIHRDLKPSNILVDGEGVPRVLDFGLAKLLAGPTDPFISFSQQVIGTLPYLSPEQTRGNPDEIDTRTDIYALGVLGYELLTGAYPYPVLGQMADVLRHIAETPPTPPDRAWTPAGGVTGRSTARRNGSWFRRAAAAEAAVPASICPLDDEIETILLKALSKARERRYQSAAELAQDIRRYLNHEPIAAKRDSGWYVLRKTLRRHRAPAAAAAAFVLTVMVAAIALYGLYLQQRRENARAVAAEGEKERQRRTAVAALEEAEQARQLAKQEQRRAEAQEARAQAEADKFRAVNGFMEDGLLRAVDPDRAAGRDVTVRAVLDDTARQLDEGALASAPAVEAEVRHTVGVLYRKLGRYAEAEDHLRRGVKLRRQTTGDADDLDLANDLNSLAVLLNARGQYEEADALYREALARYRGHWGDEHSDVALTLNNLATLLQDQGNYGAAEPLYREALATCRKLRGDDHPDVATALHNLAALLLAKGDPDAAIPLFREALDIQRARLGDEHSDVANSLNGLAVALCRRGDPVAAEPLHRTALALRRKLLGDEHPDVALSLHNLALALRDQGDYAAAEPLFREALRLVRQHLGEEHPSVAAIQENLAALLYAKGDYAAAEPLCRAALALKRKRLGNEHPGAATGLSLLALVLREQGDPAAAEPLCREALALYRKQFGDEHPHVATALNNLALVLEARGDPAAAEPLYREALAINRKTLDAAHPAVALSLHNLALLLDERGDPAAAEPLLDEALAIREKRLPAGHPDLMRTRLRLGCVWVKLRRFAAAEPLLLETEAFFQQARDAPRNRPDEARRALVELYDAWHAAEPGKGYDKKSAAWRNKLAETAATRPAAPPSP